MTIESSIRSYSRKYPCEFSRAVGHLLFDKDGNEYFDFLSVSGSMNYGHNNPTLINSLTTYINAQGIGSSLDLLTTAKQMFLDSLNAKILIPRGMDYRVQFTGPTGTNAVEAAMKLASNATGRSNFVAFTNAFHGVSHGSLSLTGNNFQRKVASTELSNVTRIPYDGYMEGVDGIELLSQYLDDDSSGVDLPAAIIVELVQGEGGVNAASVEWTKRLQSLAQRHDIVLIVDDIQAGCGRTGKFFSFEEAGISPDIVCLSKSISGIGLPMSINLVSPFIDTMKPGSHNGTFRGNNYAFVCATSAIDNYWSDKAFESSLGVKSELLNNLLLEIEYQFGCTSKGIGLFRGLEWDDVSFANKVSSRCYENGIIVETCGDKDQVLKLLPPLTISETDLEFGMKIVKKSIVECLSLNPGKNKSENIRKTSEIMV